MSNIQVKTLKTSSGNLTFVPQTPQLSTEPALWMNKDATIASAYPQVTESVVFSRTNKSKVRAKIALPITTSDATGKVAVLDVGYVDITFSLPASFSTADRQKMYDLATAELSSDSVKTGVLNLEPTW